MKLNFVLIDFENVQPLHLEKLQGLPVEIRVFLGVNQRLTVEMVTSLQPFGMAVQYIQLSGNGKNALDFHIAFYLGQLAVKHPGASFHVISKDTGFDPLIAHLKTLKISCRRCAEIEQMPLVQMAAAAPVPASAKAPDAAARTFLANPKAPKPRTMAKLRNHLKSHFQSKLSESDLEAVIGRLKAAKVFTEGEDGKLSYPAS